MTSTLYRRQDLIDEVDAFMQPDATHKEVASAGIKCPAALYDGDLTTVYPHSGTELFVWSAATVKVQSARLPPTEDAAAQHSYRIYLQVQTWLGLTKKQPIGDGPRASMSCYPSLPS